MIAALCWAEHTLDDHGASIVVHCTLPPHERGEHFHAYTRTAWPQDPGEAPRTPVSSPVRHWGRIT
ncbi:hypothetical protein AB0I66_00230 [Streptomyces sp. NPDC050439]|uniref:hypothetical protein n=1 Tax=unclassified Streptomyces TaxID=2593676 RepID=UPI003443F763